MVQNLRVVGAEYELSLLLVVGLVPEESDDGNAQKRMQGVVYLVDEQGLSALEGS